MESLLKEGDYMKYDIFEDFVNSKRPSRLQIKIASTGLMLGLVLIVLVMVSSLSERFIYVAMLTFLITIVLVMNMPRIRAGGFPYSKISYASSEKMIVNKREVYIKCIRRVVLSDQYLTIRFDEHCDDMKIESYSIGTEGSDIEEMDIPKLKMRFKTSKEAKKFQGLIFKNSRATN